MPEAVAGMADRAAADAHAGVPALAFPDPRADDREALAAARAPRGPVALADLFPHWLDPPPPPRRATSAGWPPFTL
jgi:hypothetical protein